ncbi:ABC transporter ATP-binding protein [Kutzneria sp. CA-103260]|uniref:ABC transporter ATP-binding protein n=1 Tax=Kutzneria sp. CA-103260 TaxID=2802641 RepID=UPI001BA70D5F|nr:dipeptide/oligopeptide/nickel ABC transporter ATPase [Kutzneria sp. CA-103260]
MLKVDGLRVAAGELPLVSDVSFTVGGGERVGLIGESGSGKSLTASAVFGLLPDDVTAAGSVRLDGVREDLVGAPESVLSRLRGSRLAMVFQEPMTALNPSMRVIDQVAEARLIHRAVGDRAAARRDALRLLEQVRLRDVAELGKAYPHQLSGGQRQRVLLAIALANDPDVLICDEPTTALDVTVQAQLLDLIIKGVKERSAALLFITHDLAVVATVCERVLVMYGGRIVESGPVAEVLTTPKHRYTKGLLDASDLEAVDGRGRLHAIAGAVPAAGQFPSGCVFRTRCPRADDRCGEQPPWSGEPAHGHACWHPAGGEE